MLREQNCYYFVLTIIILCLKAYSRIIDSVLVVFIILMASLNLLILLRNTLISNVGVHFVGSGLSFSIYVNQYGSPANLHSVNGKIYMYINYKGTIIHTNIYVYICLYIYIYIHTL